MSILAAINIADAYEDVLHEAQNLAKALSEKLLLIYVEHLDPSLVIEGAAPLLHLNSIIAERMEDHRSTLEQLVKSIRDRGVSADWLLEKGEPASTIIQKAGEMSVSMIIIGSRGHTLLMDLLTGSTHEGVLHRAECPVLVVPLKEDDK